MTDVLRIDPAVPPATVKQVLGPDGIHPSQWNEELQDLFNPSISARPLHVPESGRIKTVKNNAFVYYLARDRNGSNPYHERVEQLRAAGWDYATTDDVEMFSADNVKAKNEIRSGDRRLMKIPVMRWKEIRKAQNLAALDLINPRSQRSGPMTTEAMTPGVHTQVVTGHEMSKNAHIGDTTESRDAMRAKGMKESEVVQSMLAGNASTAKVKE